MSEFSSTPKQRVEIERDELEDKMNNLSRFIDSDEYDGLSKLQQILLKDQLRIMDLYKTVLKQRLENWEDK